MPPHFLPEGSVETVKTELQAFDRPQYQVSQLHGDWVEIKPDGTQVLGTSTGTPILFQIKKAPGIYIDLFHSFITLELSIVGSDEAALAATIKVALKNLALGTLFKDVSLSINGVKIEGDSAMYAYKAYFYSLLAATRTAKKYQLATAGWVDDDGDKMSLVGNTGYTERAKWTAGSKSAAFSGQLFLDLALQRQYLLDSMDIAIKFSRNEPAFCLHGFESSPDYKIKFTNMSLWARKVAIAPSVLAGHARGLMSQNAVWKYPAIKVLHNFLAAGLTNYTNTNVASGIYPKAIFLAMVENTAFSGSYTKAPYEFQPFGVKHLCMYENGRPVPSTAYTPDFTNEHIMREFLTLYLSIGEYGVYEDNVGILLKDWAKSMCIFAFNFAPDLALAGHEQPIRMNNIRLDLEFRAALATNIVLLLFCVCDTLFEYSGNGTVHVDPTQNVS